MTTYSPGPTGSVTVTVTRYGAATLSRGRYNFDATTTFDLTDANIQPANKDDLVRVPEGERDRDVQIIFTATPLQSTDKVNNIKADRITFNGNDYEVFHVDRYQMGVLDHTEAIILKVRRDA